MIVTLLVEQVHNDETDIGLNFIVKLRDSIIGAIASSHHVTSIYGPLDPLSVTMESALAPLLSISFPSSTGSPSHCLAS